MPLRFDDKWVWDFWFAQDGSDTHIFYLQADKSLKHEFLRHWNTSIGHAVSQDLRNWEVLPDAIVQSPIPNWDDFATWTGSVIRANDLWYMYYTGSTRRERGYVQRIGYATSPDLINWTKADDMPVLEADPTWYEKLDLSAWHDEAWRDPYIYYDSSTSIYHAYITGRLKDGPVDARGVIAHATSTDLHNWQIGAPVTEPGEFGHLEVPQLLHIAGRYYMLFSTPAEHHSQARQQRMQMPPVTGTHYLVGDSPTGPFRYLTDEFLVGDTIGSLYSGKLIQAVDGNWYFIAFWNMSSDGDFIGEISDPMPVSVAADGRLSVDRKAVSV